MKSLVIAVLALSALVKADKDWFEINPINAYGIPKKTAPHTPKVVGGQEAVPHSFPHQVGLLENGGLLCGGSIISENVVLTAAHCCDGAETIEAVIGAHKLLDEEITQQRINTTEFIIHEEFNATTYKNDICLVILPRKIVLDNETASIIPLHEGPCPDSSLVDLNATLSGWGITSDNSTATSPVLRYVTEVIISDAECRDTYDIAEETNICMYGGYHKGSCFGDSGGPIIMEFGNGIEQVGVDSFGSVYGCQKGYPSAFSRISCFTDWIYDNLPLVPYI